MLNNIVSNKEKSSGISMPISGHPPAPINIWLVDDNRPLRNTLKEVLDQCDGLRCQATFHSPNAVLSALASKTGPDVILLDIQMGEASGLDAIRPIKALSRSTQVLMFTSCFDSESKKRAFTDGASDFLLKHFTIQEIEASIRKALKNPAPHLKCSRMQKKAADSSRQLYSSHPDRKSERKAGSLFSRFLWLKHCVEMLHPHRN